jgi:acyl-CoA synthetase (AMP-forming)/AMP-acid ligase II
MAKFLNDDVKDRVAYVDGSTGASWTYQELHTKTHKFSHCLLDMGITKGDCIGIMSPNHIHFFTTFQGLGLIGAISSPIVSDRMTMLLSHSLKNPLYTETEIEYQLRSTQSKMVFAHPLCLEKVKIVAKKLNIPVLTFGPGLPLRTSTFLTRSSLGVAEADSIDDLISAQTKSSAIDIVVDPTSTATIPFSSGTTGLSKGVVLSHRNLVSNILQLYPSETKYFVKDTTILVPLPFFHIYGMVLGLLAVARHTTKTVFLPAFDLPKYLELVQTHRVTRTYIVPPIILALAKHPLVDSFDLSSLKTIISGAAPLGGDVQEACAKRLNCIVKQAWGMTELSPAGTISPDDLFTSPEFGKVH